MGFSDTGDKKIDETFEILSLLKTILDGKTLETVIKNSNGLSASEAAKAEEAKGLISHYESLIAEHQKKKNALDAFNESLLADQTAQKKKFDSDSAILDKKKEDNDAALLAIQTASNALDAKKADLDKKSKEAATALKDAETINQQARSALDSVEKSKADLAAKWKEVNDYEAGLKATAAQLQKITGGL